VRVLRTVGEVAVLAMRHPRQACPLGGPIPFAFIGAEHPWDVLTALQERADELLGGLLVAPPLHQDVELYAILIHCPPPSMPFLRDRDAHCIQGPLITRPGTPATEGMGLGVAELAAPRADRCVRHEHPTDTQAFFPIAVAERDAEIQPAGVADDLPRAALMFVGISVGWGCHGSSTSSTVVRAGTLLSGGAAEAA
jgi:hypothetical protein